MYIKVNACFYACIHAFSQIFYQMVFGQFLIYCSSNLCNNEGKREGCLFPFPAGLG